MTIGTMTQQPLYGCAGCYELQTFHASDLRVHDRECWCDRCWDEYKEAETGIEYSDLPAFEPCMPAPDVTVLVDALERVMYCNEVKFLPEGVQQAVSDALAAHRKGGE